LDSSLSKKQGKGIDVIFLEDLKKRTEEALVQWRRQKTGALAGNPFLFLLNHRQLLRVTKIISESTGDMRVCNLFLGYGSWKIDINLFQETTISELLPYFVSIFPGVQHSVIRECISEKLKLPKTGNFFSALSDIIGTLGQKHVTAPKST
jgi:hypothetical protein